MQIVFSRDADCHLYFVTDSKLQQMSYHGDLYEMIRRIGKEQLPSCEYLLDEAYFQFVNFAVRIESGEPLTQAKMNQLVVEKINLLKTQWIRSPYINHFVSDILIDGEESKFAVGKSGSIQFQLHLFFLKPDAVTSFEVIAGRDSLLAHEMRIMPKSFYTVQYLRDKIKKSSFRLLYIREDTCHLMQIDQWSYKSVQHMRLGLQLLKWSYEEQDILNYYYTRTEDLENNSFLRKLVVEANEFYTDMLCKWLAQYVPSDKEVILISDIVSNTFFIESLQKSYRETVNGYLLPISSVKSTITQEYKPHELDVVTCYQALKKG